MGRAKRDERDGVDERVGIDGALGESQEERRFATQGTAKIGVDVAIHVVGLVGGVRVARVEKGVAIEHAEAGRNFSLPGLVRTSIRPKPMRSYSAESGF